MVLFKNILILHFEKYFEKDVNFLFIFYSKKFPNVLLDLDTIQIPLVKIIEIGLYLCNELILKEKRSIISALFFNFVNACKNVDFFDIVQVLYNDLTNTQNYITNLNFSNTFTPQKPIQQEPIKVGEEKKQVSLEKIVKKKQPTAENTKKSSVKKTIAKKSTKIKNLTVMLDDLKSSLVNNEEEENIDIEKITNEEMFENNIENLVLNKEELFELEKFLNFENE